MISKSALRKELIRQRYTLSEEKYREKSNQLCFLLEQQNCFQQAKTILAYFSYNREPDLNLLFHNYPEKKWAFPRCVGQQLRWHYWQVDQPLKKGKYGIVEPLETAELMYPDQVDLILVPAVACNEKKYRLGYGGGYFDRLLSQYPWSTFPTIGILFDFAYNIPFSHDEWDIPLQAICTEKRFIH